MSAGERRAGLREPLTPSTDATSATLLALMDDDVEAVSRIVAMEGGLHGHDGMRRWWESWFTPSPTTTIEVVEVRDAWRP